jgi:hypothetical protein
LLTANEEVYEMINAKEHGDAATDAIPQVDGVDPLPWELIDNGRYMPRRIRGSCLGRELG